MSKIDDRNVYVLAGVTVGGARVSLTEDDATIDLYATGHVSLNVDAARRLARELYRLARRVEQRQGAPEKDR